MSDPLECPRHVDELYLARADEVSVFRPIMTGDIFAGIEIPGVEGVAGDDEHLGLVVSHPCSMRQGDQLRSHVQVLRIVKAPPLDLPAWKHHYDRIPLPQLYGSTEGETVDESESHAALFDLRGRVPSSQLELDQRVACLSEEGVGYLHQRMSHADTRYAPRVQDVVEACAAVFVEAELAEEWASQLVKESEMSDPVRRAEALGAAAKDFDDELGRQREVSTGKKPVKYTLRGDLQVQGKVPTVRREIRKIIKARAA